MKKIIQLSLSQEIQVENTVFISCKPNCKRKSLLESERNFLVKNVTAGNERIVKFV